MLPRARRVTSPDEFRRVLRRGRKAGRSRLVVHALAASGPCSRAGFVVGRKVGPSVTRHRVTRRLRHLVGARLDLLPAGTLLVVRAQPPASGASSADLAADLDAALQRLGLVAPALDAAPAPAGSGGCREVVPVTGAAGPGTMEDGPVGPHRDPAPTVGGRRA